MEPCARRLRSLEWACANARAGRRAMARVKALGVKRAVAGADGDVPMLVLDGAARDDAAPSSGDDTETEDDEDEAITPNVSVELLPAFSLSSEDGVPERAAKPAKGKDMEAAMALLGFMGPEA